MAAHKILVLPRCRFCEREWSPPEYVSANVAFCDECRPEHLAIAQQRVRGMQFIRGGNGERVAIPDKAR